MTIKELLKSKMQQDWSYIIAVVNLEAIATAGLAMLSIDLLQHLEIFIKIRESS